MLESIRSLPFFERRRALKWHADVTAVAGDLRPAPTASSSGQFHLFPYAQLHAVTKEYLGKRTRSPSEQDKVLLELISKHPCKEVAFAACVDKLSLGTVEELLNSSFDVEINSLSGLNSYLHAFVAAAHIQELGFSGLDQELARTLVVVAKDVVNHEIQPATAGASLPDQLFTTLTLCMIVLQAVC